MPPSRKSKEIQYASFTYRMLASVIDTILSAIVFYPFLAAACKFADICKTGNIIIPAADITPIQALELYTQMLMENLSANILEFSLAFFFIIFFWVYKGGTPGKILFKMKIVDAKTHQKIGVVQSIVRFFAYIASVVPCLLGFIWIYFDKRKQGFHDKIARTVVIINKSDTQTNEKES
ncbi:MAG: hypothetical protein COV35_08600 [Alphaproteobacteria bacterium CG11_big_fil_rev_8_21_14_0_20_39_49]|nr:MAG: hypothetical protein COV35_08600 [Alphaproteobacteria bacterium CG11_big_fil_rev_8_21_14_0_20_39_49]